MRRTYIVLTWFLLLIVTALVLSGCERRKILHGAGQYWEAKVIMEAYFFIRPTPDGINRKTLNIRNSTVIRYVGSGRPDGPIKIVTGLPELSHRNALEYGSGVHYGKWVKAGTFGISRTNITWQDIDRLSRSGEVTISWQEDGNMRTETISVYDNSNTLENSK
ncbi:MAG: hypothetical protein ACPLQO_10335 [Desulfotomaculales bacterium]